MNAHISTGMVPGGAIGMDTGTTEAHWRWQKANPNVRPSPVKSIPAG